ncbi:unnamed protein product [Nesidiocoris tenuis]|uniref:Uncharacterized protein n=1 Tax=Nesidiocoris tenuis TaxID=355587 RepID=A0A6H5HI50_9HEMI|nr:unnamed protein product [Nesidiocoris tenuis]
MASVGDGVAHMTSCVPGRSACVQPSGVQTQYRNRMRKRTNCSTTLIGKLDWLYICVYQSRHRDSTTARKQKPVKLPGTRSNKSICARQFTIESNELKKFKIGSVELPCQIRENAEIALRCLSQTDSKTKFSNFFGKTTLSYGKSSEKPGKNTQKILNPRHHLQN